jgi:hypothetical protein
MEKNKKCLHSLDEHDIDSGRSSVKLVYSVRIEDKITLAHHYCQRCGAHWQNGRFFSASDWAVDKIHLNNKKTNKEKL